MRIGIAQHDFSHCYTSAHRDDAGICGSRGTGGDRLRQEGIEVVHLKTEVGGTDVGDMTFKPGARNSGAKKVLATRLRQCGAVDFGRSMGRPGIDTPPIVPAGG